MARRAPVEDINEANITFTPPSHQVAGVKAVAVALGRGLAQSGIIRTAKALVRLNQRGGFDCPGCAWPEPDGRRRPAEFCENGAKAVAEESTTRTVTPEFFQTHSLSALEAKTEYWLGQQGRLTHPMVLREGADHYEPISWEAAFDLIADHLNATTPDRAAFYTSGRTSNEAAFLYQLFARSYGTNNLPDCSNMCHESSGSALIDTIGIGKGSVSLADIQQSDLIFVVGQNPGTNHPRMLSALAEAKSHGAHIVAVNPLPEAGLFSFRDPQKLSGVIGSGVTLADTFLQISLGGDMALFQALGHLLAEKEKAHPGTVFDTDFLASSTEGLDEYLTAAAQLDWAEVLAATGLTREQIEQVADLLAASKGTIICWAMGLTQHPHSVVTLKEIVNVLLLRGMIGKPGAGVCPVRGHSNVQGDRTMGIWEKAPDSFLDSLDREFGITSPRVHGFDTVETLQAMAQGEIDVFIAMGGNFAGATPDTEQTERSLRQVGLTVQISTKLNRSHVVHGKVALILPTLGRTDRDDQHPGGSQFVTVEDSMSAVHISRGRLEPVSDCLLAEPVIIGRLAAAVLGQSHSVPWLALADDYDLIRDRIANVIPGFTDFNTRVRTKNGFVLPHPPRDSRTFATPTSKAHITVNPLQRPDIAPGRLLLQTLRSHDQYNTTIYGLDDRYRGVKDGRKVIMVNPEDLAELGFVDRELVDIVSEWTTASGELQERRARAFRVLAYPIARRSAAAYFPEANVLVPTDSVAAGSNTPTSKSVVIRLEHVH